MYPLRRPAVVTAGLLVHVLALAATAASLQGGDLSYLSWSASRAEAVIQAMDKDGRVGGFFRHADSLDEPVVQLQTLCHLAHTRGCQSQPAWPSSKAICLTTRHGNSSLRPKPLVTPSFSSRSIRARAQELFLLAGGPSFDLRG